MNFIKHCNKTNWGTVWHLITSDGVGHIAIEMYDGDDLTMYFYGLSVIPEKRNLGIGNQLLREAENLAKENNITRCRLNIDKGENEDKLYKYYIERGYELWDSDNEQIYLIKYI